MEGIASGVVVAIGLTIVVLVLAFIYEIGRRCYYWTAAKLFGWSPSEKLNRETAWIDRAVTRDKRLADRDSTALSDTYRRRFGVQLLTVAVVIVACNLLPWWEGVALGVVTYAGGTMAAGLSWKLW
jgi:hypothetical protein